MAIVRKYFFSFVKEQAKYLKNSPKSGQKVARQRFSAIFGFNHDIKFCEVTTLPLNGYNFI